jgi:tetratricopeptide (TPR) repeat protein
VAANEEMAPRDSLKAPVCSLPLAKRTALPNGDDCVACHMPRNASTTGRHLAVTDHRVLRIPERTTAPPPKLARGEIPLLAFHRQLPGDRDDESSRDLGLAVMPLALAAMEGGAEPIGAYLCQLALPLLDAAAARAPDDVPALEARGIALYIVGGRLQDSLQALESVLALAPDREQALSWAGHVAERNGKFDAAERYYRRLTERYPQFAGHHEQLAAFYAKREAWPRAVEAAQTALQIDPFAVEARVVLVQAHLAMGKRAQALAEFEVLGVLHPATQARIRPWLPKNEN